MATLYVGRQDETVDYSSLAAHHPVFLRTTLKRVLICIDDLTSRDDSPLVCADFGTGDGGLAVKIFEAVKGHLSSKQDDRELTFMLEDQETNDFNKSIHSFRNSSLWRDDKISILFNGQNMYKRCFPTASLDLVLSTFATMFLDKPSLPVTGSLFPIHVKLPCQERKVFRDKIIDQWCDFMKARSVELRKGGYLINYVPHASVDSKPCGLWPGGFEMLNEVWKSLCADKNNDSLSRVTYPIYYGTTEDYLAPFQDGVYSGLRLISIEVAETDVYKYPQKTGNEQEDAKHMEEFAANITLYTKSWMHNGLKTNFPNSLSNTEKDELLDAYYTRLQDRIRKGDLEDGSFQVAEIILKRI